MDIYCFAVATHAFLVGFGALFDRQNEQPRYPMTGAMIILLLFADAAVLLTGSLENLCWGALLGAILGDFYALKKKVS